jgi:hypothetical protein
MQNRKKYLTVLFVIALIIFAAFWYFKNKEQMRTLPVVDVKEVAKEDAAIKPRIVDATDIIEEVKIPDTVNLDVPFTSQAPTGNWKEEVFQDGCEEASALMAMAWIGKIKLSTPVNVEQQIRKITAFEKQQFGNAIDISSEDTTKMMREYFEYPNIEVRKQITIDDIKKELAKGNLVLVPAFGQALKNPNYTAPGPITHMLVVKGYDETKQIFITNDSGTKRGKDYAYDQQVLFDAIWTYPTAKQHATAAEKYKREKSMIVISKMK